MIAALPETFRGVLCRRCEKPIRAPEKIENRDGQNASSAKKDERHYLVSQTFVLRCRACQKESVYAVNQIMDCTLDQRSE
jgi:hypothetical protein